MFQLNVFFLLNLLIFFQYFFFFLMIRRPPRSTQGVSSAASDVYKRQVSTQSTWELRTIHEQQQHFIDLKQQERMETKRLEEEEEARLKEIERRKIQMRAIKEGKVQAHQKLMSRMLAKNYLKGLKQDTLRLMKSEGAFRQDYENDLHMKYVPWMYTTTMDLIEKETETENALMDLIEDACNNHLASHEEHLKKEKERREKISNDIHEKEEAEAAAKEQRRQQRAEKRRMDELSQLHDKIDALIIKKGELKDDVLREEITNVHGFFQSKNSVGIIGGLLYEMAIMITTLNELLENKEFLSEKNVYIFTIMYIGEWMKQEFFPVFLSPNIMNFLASKNVKPEEIHNIEEDAEAEFKQLFMSDDEEDKLFNVIKEKSHFLGIKPETYQYIKIAIMKLLLRKPTMPDPKGRNMNAKNRIKVLSYPEGFDKDPLNPQAIIKVNVPAEILEELSQEIEEKKKEEKKKKGGEKGGKKSLDTSKKVDKTVTEEGVVDKVYTVKPLSEDLFVYAINEDINKIVRNDFADFALHTFDKQLTGIEITTIKEKAEEIGSEMENIFFETCLLYTSPSPRDLSTSRMPSSA
eukprot:TRINITY_DN4913_c0_g1_i6.p1 TRINITY_DN4913_c0_g1~~TRINITY_DN4913_c0_g1_i6.p1  ORF type:complete len:578 (-),score=174.41 TRINITY_DN4913_c0_g1_i6:22-1755(-)